MPAQQRQVEPSCRPSLPRPSRANRDLPETSQPTQSHGDINNIRLRNRPHLDFRSDPQPSNLKGQEDELNQAATRQGVPLSYLKQERHKRDITSNDTDDPLKPKTIGDATQPKLTKKRGRGRPPGGNSHVPRSACPHCTKTYNDSYLRQHIRLQHFGAVTLRPTQPKQNHNNTPRRLYNSSEDAHGVTDDEYGHQDQQPMPKKPLQELAAKGLKAAQSRQEDDKENMPDRQPSQAEDDNINLYRQGWRNRWSGLV